VTPLRRSLEDVAAAAEQSFAGFEDARRSGDGGLDSDEGRGRVDEVEVAVDRSDSVDKRRQQNVSASTSISSEIE
jgi:hypothetical protein